VRRAVELLTVVAGLALFGALPLLLLAGFAAIFDPDRLGPHAGPWLGLVFAVGALLGAYWIGHKLHTAYLRRYWRRARGQ
jgi:hypothetical protein